MSGPRTIAAMHDPRAGRRDLALAAVTVVGLSRLIEPPGVWFVAIFLLGAVILGSLQVLGEETAHTEHHALGVPIESLILPAVAAVACLGAMRLVPFGLWLAPALVVTGVLVERCLALEARILSSPSGLDAEGRTTVLVTTLKHGVRNQTEFPSNGMNVAVSRVVRDRAGAVIHRETYTSAYTLWNGRIEIGR